MSDAAPAPATTVTTVGREASKESLRQLIATLREDCSGLAKIISADNVGIIERFRELKPAHPDQHRMSHPQLIMYPQHAIRGYIANLCETIDAMRSDENYSASRIQDLVTYGDRNRNLLPSENGKSGQASLEKITVGEMRRFVATICR